METTKLLKLKVTTDTTYETDKIRDTIVQTGENFKVVEQATMQTTGGSKQFETGSVHPKGERYWNDTPLSGSYVGWVNERQGTFAPDWKPSHTYKVNDLASPSVNNGNVYKCIKEGKSAKSEPSFLSGSGIEFSEHLKTPWKNEHLYNIGEVVFALDGSEVFYYICEKAGLSKDIEPKWSTIPSGSTIVDGTVTWRKEQTVKWKQVAVSCSFRPFGRID